MFDPHKDQWWNAPQNQRFEAYYMTMRVHYGMPASEALAYAIKAFKKYPDFMNEPMDTLRKAIAR